MQRTSPVILTLLVLSSAALCSTGCDSGGGGGITLPAAPEPVTNQPAAIVDMRSNGRTKPAFEMRIDGQPVGRIDGTQSSIHCQGRFFGKCFVGGSVTNVKSGKHVVRVKLTDQVGLVSTWELRGTAKLTVVSPVLSETIIDLRSKTRNLRRNGVVEWEFQVQLWHRTLTTCTGPGSTSTSRSIRSSHPSAAVSR